ncbi:hypothetical protein ACLOJK_039117 [Asimina triloba]
METGSVMSSVLPSSSDGEIWLFSSSNLTTGGASPKPISSNSYDRSKNPPWAMGFGSGNRRQPTPSLIRTSASPSSSLTISNGRPDRAAEIDG